MSEDLWQTYAMEVGQHRQWPIGDAVFHVRREPDEWQVARQPTDDDGEPPWKRWPADASWSDVVLAPAMPDRPVVARPESPVQLAPGCEARFFVSIPLWVRFTVAGVEPALALLDAPAVVLSSIWFGEPTEGELCYSLKTRARRCDTQDSAENPHRAVCPVRMINETEAAVEFQRVCLQGKHLNIYRGATHLWTDAVDVAWPRGQAVTARVKVAGRPTEAEQDAEPLAKARVAPPTGHFWQKGMGMVKTWI